MGDKTFEVTTTVVTVVKAVIQAESAKQAVNMFREGKNKNSRFETFFSEKADTLVTEQVIDIGGTLS